MPHGPSHFDTFGICIYCGRSDTRLTDEHIVPHALGGQHVIREASCSDCARITSRFELDVARGMWGDARIHYASPSRRKRIRPTHIILQDSENSSRRVKVPYSEYPAPMIFYIMNRAGILEGVPETLDISSIWQFSAMTDDAKAKEFENKFGMKLVTKFKHVPDSFARLLAKIAYGQVLTTLPLGTFRPLCLPYILGEKKNLSYIVGGTPSTPSPNDGLGYKLTTVGFGDKTRLVLLAEIRLYANASTPVYHVVVGDVSGQEAVESAWSKLDGVETTGFAGQPSHVSQHATWMPKVWPLPTFALS